MDLVPKKPWLLLLLSIFLVYADAVNGSQQLRRSLNNFTLVGAVGTKTFYTGFAAANRTWMGAQEYCNQEGIAGMQLASLETQMEEDVVVDYLLQNQVDVLQFWLSATDFGTEGEYHWTRSGSLVPKSVQNGGINENCLKLQAPKTFFAERCTGFENTKLWALCEVQSDPSIPTTAHPNSTIPTTMRPNTTTTVYPNSTTTLHPNSTTTLHPNSTTTMRPNTTTTLHPNSTTTLHPNSTTTLHPNSTTTLNPNSTTTLHPNSTTTLNPNSTTTLHPNSTTTLHPNSTTTLHPNSTTTLNPNSTTTLHPNSTTTMRPNSTTTRPPFQCLSEGKHPDPYDCSIFHECVKFRDEFIDYEFTCPVFTNYCPDMQVCGDPDVCPCNLERDVVDLVNSHSAEKQSFAIVNETDLIRVGKVGLKTLFTYRAPAPYFNWMECMEFCHANGMMLARMETDAERNLMTSYLTGTSPRYFWLSGVDYGSEGKYYWINSGVAVAGPIYGNGGRDSNCLYLSSSPLYDWSCENHRNVGMWPLCQVVDDAES